jgi:hypothetical protein
MVVSQAGMTHAGRPAGRAAGTGRCRLRGKDRPNARPANQRAPLRALHAARLAALGVALALAGCASVQPPDVLHGVPALRAMWAADGVRDLRGMYRQALCRRLAVASAQGPGAAVDCDQVLPDAGDEAMSGALPVADRARLAARYRVLLVAGLFAECFGTPTRPMTDVMQALQADGFDVTRMDLSGRGGAVANADALARQIRALDVDGRGFIVLAYSKGLVDILEMAARHPDLVPRIAAVISLAGAARGTPLADEYGESYRHWLAHLPMPGCEAGTGEELLDLTRTRRAQWWQTHRGALGLPVYTLVAAPAPGRISPLLRLNYRALARVDPRNDGQLLWGDQIAPDSVLLGFINADHWGIANPLSRSLPLFAFLFVDDVPRAHIVAAAIEVVDATLPSAGGVRRTP